MKLEKTSTIILASIFAVALIFYLILGTAFEFFDLIKPVTIMQYTGFLVFALLLNIFKRPFKELSNRYLELLIILGFFAVMACAFELLWSFFYWFAIFIKDSPISNQALDALTYTPKNTQLYDRLSLNFSAKKNMLLTMMSIYFVYFINSVKKEKKSKPKL